MALGRESHPAFMPIRSASTGVVADVDITWSAVRPVGVVRFLERVYVETHSKACAG
jgi:hypothetical protein